MSTIDDSRRTRTRAPALALLIALVSAPLGSVAHQLAVEHRVCEHGHVVHAGERGHAAAMPFRSDHDHDATAQSPPPPARHDHDHCEALALVHEPFTAVAPPASAPAPEPASPGDAASPDRARCVASIELLHLAPKTSPPA